MEAPGMPLYMVISGMGAVITAFSPLSTASISFFRAYVGRTVSFT
ncbi:unknown [Bacteroides uniformis CAG:3]|nr:unknown [Bacteroides uniformis CAG:3]